MLPRALIGRREFIIGAGALAAAVLSETESYAGKPDKQDQTHMYHVESRWWGKRLYGDLIFHEHLNTTSNRYRVTIHGILNYFFEFPVRLTSHGFIDAKGLCNPTFSQISIESKLAHALGMKNITLEYNYGMQQITFAKEGESVKTKPFEIGKRPDDIGSAYFNLRHDFFPWFENKAIIYMVTMNKRDREPEYKPLRIVRQRDADSFTLETWDFYRYIPAVTQGNPTRIRLSLEDRTVREVTTMVKKEKAVITWIS